MEAGGENAEGETLAEAEDEDRHRRLGSGDRELAEGSARASRTTSAKKMGSGPNFPRGSQP